MKKKSEAEHYEENKQIILLHGLTEVAAQIVVARNELLAASKSPNEK